MNPKSDPYAAIAERTPKARTIGAYKNGQVSVIKQPMAVRTKPIAIGIPCDEVMFTKFFRNYQRLTIMPWDDLLGTDSTYLPEARNAIHDIFLETSGCEYLFMLDSDVMPQPDIIDRLLAHHLPVVGGWYKKKDTGQPVVYDYLNTDEGGVARWKIRDGAGQGLEKVDGAGAGCWLMHRDAVKAIGKSPYDMNRGGEDLDLCLKLHAAGVDTYIDWSLACAHARVSYV